MKVTLGTVEVSDDFRRALACRHGEHRRLASREDVRNWRLMHGESIDDDLMYEHDGCEVCNPESAQ